jgi:hypothetical protein
VVTESSVVGTFLLLKRGVALLEDFTCKNVRMLGSAAKGER